MEIKGKKRPLRVTKIARRLKTLKMKRKKKALKTVNKLVNINKKAKQEL